MDTVSTSGADPAVGIDSFLAELGSVELDSQPLDSLLQRVAELARNAVPGADDVSVTLLEGSRPRTAAFTGSVSAALDEQQYLVGQGPCLDAALSENTVVFPVAQRERYPAFAEAAAAHGVTSVMSVGLRSSQRVVGALNMYSTGRDPYGGDAAELAQNLAGYAATTLTNAALYRSTADLAENLQAAMASRAVIEQAKGILMAQHRCSAEQAFMMLSTASQRSNRKLREIAQGVVDTVVDGQHSPDGQRPD